jgi:hypothetical protein
MKKLLMFAVVFAFSSAFAFVDQKALSVLADIKGDDSFNYPDYYQVKEDPRFQFVNLLVFDHIKESFPKPAIPYNRKNQFGTWIQDQVNHTCLNTRGLVLIRDSLSSVTYAASGCSVSRGDWNDPYSDQHFTSASEIQIDHFVPLKNAYMTGAHEWTYLKRCQYANYIGNAFHLIAVSGTENMKKSDSSPSQYVPPNQDYVCAYLKQWLEVKTIWTLRVTPKEADALKAKVASHNCNPEDFIVPTQFLTEQRKYMADHADICSGVLTNE